MKLGADVGLLEGTAVGANEGSDDGSHLGSCTARLRRKAGGKIMILSSFVSISGGLVGGSVGTHIGIGALVSISSPVQQTSPA
mmetsp:Transcript_64392/g.95336  ORF Transcript_64392/g.95336 Transcript_64392/m.95336 type:complete len:83 (+) Transcript_64392:142-390(+)